MKKPLPYDDEQASERLREAVGNLHDALEKDGYCARCPSQGVVVFERSVSYWLDSLERLRDGQRTTFSDRYPLREYHAGGTNEEAIKPRSADDIDNRDDTNKEVDL